MSDTINISYTSYTEINKEKVLEEKINEYLRCRDNPIYFIENYIVLDLPGKSIKMKMYDVQKKFLKSLLEDHYCIALKSRQVGISTITQAWIVYSMVFYKNVSVGVISRDGDESTDFCRKVVNMIKELPDWLRPDFIKNAERTFILSNNSKFFASQVSIQNPSKTFRGKSITICVIDEAAFIDKIDEAFTGFAPALFKNQQVAQKQGVPYGTVIISTPNKTFGIGRWFFERWQEASSHHSGERGSSIYIPHKIHWKDIPEFRDDPNWYQQQCAILHNDPIKIAQELEMKFISSVSSFFDSDVIDKLNTAYKPYKYKLYISDTPLLLWEYPPQENKLYLLSIDVASFSGSDFSVIEILDYEDFVQIGELSAKCRVDKFLEIVKNVVNIFSNCLIIIENNSYGNQIIEGLTRSNLSSKLYKYRDKNGNESYGINTNALTRPLIIDALYTCVKRDPTMVRSEALALELMGLENVKGKIQASAKTHDDRAMALAFACYVRLYDPPLNISMDLIQNINRDVQGILFDNEVESMRLTNSGQNMVVVSSDMDVIEIGGGRYKDPNQLKRYNEEVKNKVFQHLQQHTNHQNSPFGGVVDSVINVFDLFDFQ